MSKIKPKFWIAKSDFVSLTDADEGCDALHQWTTVSRGCCKIFPDDEPLYTADELAEAVAAERERCAKACKDVRLNEISAPADWHNDACEACIRAIRSAAK